MEEYKGVGKYTLCREAMREREKERRERKRERGEGGRGHRKLIAIRFICVMSR